MKKKIAVIGSGIAGLTIANLFKKNLNFEIMVYEKEKTLSLEEGYGIQLAPNSISILNKINHDETYKRAHTERNILKVLDGDCETAIGVYSSIKNDIIELKAELFSIDGNERYYVKSSKNISQANELGLEVGENLKRQSKGNYKK